MLRLIIQITLLSCSAPFVFGQLLPDAIVYGDSAGDRLGIAMSMAGDVDADGYDDFIVGAYRDDTNGTDSGSARVYSGFDYSIIHTFHGDSAADYFGRSVAGIGDINGDGHDDLIVGAYGDDDNGGNCGGVRVFSGIDGTILYTRHGDQAGYFMGISVAGGGDVNNDGVPDFVGGAVSALGSGGGLGLARVYSGLDGSILHDLVATAEIIDLGRSVDIVGDCDGDGHADVIVGAPLSPDPGGANVRGKAMIYSGSDGSVLHTFVGPSLDAQFGSCVRGAGDVDGDGSPDVIIGAWFDSSAAYLGGGVYVYSGADGSLLHGTQGLLTDLLGYDVAAAGDVNADGHADFAATAVSEPPCGTTRIYSGLDGSVLHLLTGTVTSDEYGSSVCGGGDLNGDGYPDLVVGVSKDDDNGSDCGGAWVYLLPYVGPTPIGGGQANGATGSLLVNGVPVGFTPGPFISTLALGQYNTLDLEGAPDMLYEVYASGLLNPGGWLFPGFGSFDLGTGPNFSDVFILLPGFQPYFPFYSLDGAGLSQISFYVNPGLAPGTIIGIQAVIQLPPPHVGGIWATITAAHRLDIQ